MLKPRTLLLSKFMLRALIVLAIATLALTSCGTPGAPQPPSLWLPQPPDDLTAVRKGNNVTLSWTMPRETTDGATLKASKLGPTKICRGLGDPLTSCTDAKSAPPNSGIFVGQLAPSKTPIPQQERGAPKLTFTDTLTPDVQQGHETDFATYAVQLFNENGKAAAPSNQVKIPLAPILQTVITVEGQVQAKAILLSWPIKHLYQIPKGLSDAYRVTRRQEGVPQPTVVTCEPPDHFLDTSLYACADHSFAWETTYYYKVTPLTRLMKDGKVIAEVEGDDSPEIKVYTKDTFPPAPPSGVQAVFSGTGQKPFIDLTWGPNTEEDLSGYNVYRHEQNASPQKINAKLAPTPSFRDDTVEPGHTYFYSVSAVDLRNNESPHSEETSETVPK